MTAPVETCRVRPVDTSRPEIEVLTRTRADQVLLVGGDDWALNDVQNQFSAQQRTVHRCSATAEAPFPCNAFQPEGCPLDNFDVDVVVVVRGRPASHSCSAEMGAVCGVRDGLPLVIAGIAEGSTFAPWAERVGQSRDVVTTCDQSVAAR